MITNVHEYSISFGFTYFIFVFSRKAERAYEDKKVGQTVYPSQSPVANLFLKIFDH